MKKFLELVTTVEEVAENIHRYNRALRTDERLVSRMPYARAWYALADGNSFLLAPSKVIGYKNFDPDVYFANKNKDGRKTETRLQTLSTLVGIGHPKMSYLSGELSKLLGSFGHSPNTSSRISLIETKGEVRENGDANHIQAIMELIVRLPVSSREVVKHRVADL